MNETRKLVFPEPKIFGEIRAMRRKVNGKAGRLGWEQFVAQLNDRAGHLLGKSAARSPRKSSLALADAKKVFSPSEGRERVIQPAAVKRR
jgi:hypothetical protein